MLLNMLFVLIKGNIGIFKENIYFLGGHKNERSSYHIKRFGKLICKE